MNHDLASYSVICDISGSRVSSNVTRLYLQKCLFLATEALIKFLMNIGQRSGSKIRIKSMWRKITDTRCSILWDELTNTHISIHTRSQLRGCFAQHRSALLTAVDSDIPLSALLQVILHRFPLSYFAMALSSVVSKLWDWVKLDQFRTKQKWIKLEGALEFI